MAKNMNDLLRSCKKGTKVERFNVLFLYPGKEMDLFKKWLEIPEKLTIHWYGYRDRQYALDQVRGMKTYTTNNWPHHFHFVVGIDCLHWFTAQGLSELLGSRITRKSVIWANHRSAVEKGLGLLIDQVTIPEYRKETLDDEEDEDTAPSSDYVPTGGKHTAIGSVSFVVDSDTGPVMHYASSLFDSGFTHPVGTDWNHIVINDSAWTGYGFEIHTHRAYPEFGMELLSMTMSHENTKRREYGRANPTVIAVNGAVLSAIPVVVRRIQSSDMTTVEGFDSVERAARREIKTALPKQVRNLRWFPGDLSEEERKTATGLEWMDDLVSGTVIAAQRAYARPRYDGVDWLRESPAIEVGRQTFNVGRPLGGFLAHTSQPARSKTVAVTNLVRGIVSFFHDVQAWRVESRDSEPKVVVVDDTVQPAKEKEEQDESTLSDAELSVPRATYQAVLAIYYRYRRWRRKAVTQVNFLHWLMKMPAWRDRLTKFTYWCDRNPGALAVLDVGLDLFESIATAVVEEVIKHISPVARIRAIAGSAFGVYEGVCYLIANGWSWKLFVETVIRSGIHLALALMPLPAAIPVHAFINFVMTIGRHWGPWAKNLGGPDGWLRSVHRFGKMMIDADAEHFTHEEAGLYFEQLCSREARVGDPLPMAVPNIDLNVINKDICPRPSVYKDHELLGLEELTDLAEEVDELYQQKVENSGRILAFPNDCAQTMVRPANHPLILLEVYEQRIGKECLFEEVEACVAEGHQALRACLAREGMQFDLLTQWQLIAKIMASDRPTDWKEKMVKGLFGTFEAQYLSMFAKSDEMLKNKGYIQSLFQKEELHLLRAWAKTRPIIPLSPGEYAEQSFAAPAKEEFGSRPIRLSYEDAEVDVLYRFIECPNDTVITDCVDQMIDECDVAITGHGDDLAFHTKYGSTDGDAVSADKTEAEFNQKQIGLTLNQMSDGDPEMAEAWERHYRNLQREYKIRPHAFREFGMHILGPGRVQTITGECLTALKNGFCLAAACAGACYLCEAILRKYRAAGLPMDEESAVHVYILCVRRFGSLMGLDIGIQRAPDFTTEEEFFVLCHRVAQGLRFLGPMCSSTFLGGSFAPAAFVKVPLNGPVRENYWYSLSVIKSIYMPSGVFKFDALDTPVDEAFRWAGICAKQLAGSPASLAFANMARLYYDRQKPGLEEKVEFRWSNYVTRNNVYVKANACNYHLTFEGWELCLMALCGPLVPETEITELVHEFKSKTLATEFSDDLLFFKNSWRPLFVSRFGCLPAEVPETSNG
jgi:hypothetical protein